MTTREFCAALPEETRGALRRWEREMAQVASAVAGRGGGQREVRGAENEGVYVHAMERAEAEALLLLHSHHAPPGSALSGRSTARTERLTRELARAGVTHARDVMNGTGTRMMTAAQLARKCGTITADDAQAVLDSVPERARAALRQAGQTKMRTGEYWTAPGGCVHRVTARGWRGTLKQAKMAAPMFPPLFG